MISAMLDDKKPSQDRLARQITIQIVKDRLSPFGEEISALVVEFAVRPERMQFLLKTLGLFPHGEFDDQLAALAAYLENEDPGRFLMRARREIWIEMQRAGLAGGTKSRSDADPLSTNYPTRTPVPGVNSLNPRSGTTPRSPTATHRDRDVDWADSKDEKPKVAASTESPTKSWITVPGYRGPDRRKGPTNRRTGKGRRQTIQPVSVKRRLGGDRRKNQRGRRMTDR